MSGIQDCVKKPVTYRSLMYTHKPEEYWFIAEMLSGTGVKAREYGGTVRLEWPAPADCERGTSEPVWGMDWVVVSSLLEVRILRTDEYEREFSTV